MTKFFSLALLAIAYLGFSQDSLRYDESFLLGKKEAIISSQTGLLPQVEIAFLEMQSAAKKDSLNIKIVSSFRSYTAQKEFGTENTAAFLSRGFLQKRRCKK